MRGWRKERKIRREKVGKRKRNEDRGSEKEKDDS